MSSKKSSIVAVSTGKLEVANCDIKSCIHIIRGVQAIVDRDLAALYGVQTGNLNKAVKRNQERFPTDFMFQLTKEEGLRFQNGILDEGEDPLRFQSGILKQGRGKHFKYQPYAFTENGIAMLSSVLHSERAIAINIRIMREFVAMRKMLVSLGPTLARIEANERRQIADQARNEERFTELFDAMRDKRFPDQKVFYNGEVFDARAFATKHILSAKQSILLIDNWVDIGTLEILSKKAKDVSVELVTSPRGNKLKPTDVVLFNEQYGGLTLKNSTAFHDRFLIVDNKHLYLIGASLKDLGKKCFAFTKLDASEIEGLKARI